MERRSLLVWCAVLTILTIVAIASIDRPLAMALRDSAPATAALIHPAIDTVEVIFGFPLSKWLTGFVILVAALVALARRAWRPVGWLLLFVAASQLTTRLVAGVLKNVFLRARPFENLAGPFFIDGSSFPSGHAAHFWPLYFAAAIAFPRLRWPLLVLAILVSIARVAVIDHFLSDVTASAALAALITFGYARWLRLPRAATQ
ncbi:MAG TPA: phosphatase PAP2 family protein [Thermoanaerobaculia bacterium]|jgi:membrane-associated phospholipid phosphatase